MAFEANANSDRKSGVSKDGKSAGFFKRVWGFIVESKNEIKRITWPDKSRIIRSTTVVLTSVIIITLFIWLIDSVFNLGLSYFLKLLG